MAKSKLLYVAIGDQKDQRQKTCDRENESIEISGTARHSEKISGRDQ